jgi:hypothetical protein
MSCRPQCLAPRPLATVLLTALTAWTLFIGALAAAATPSRGDIVVVTVHGEVSATMAGMTVPLSAGAILQLPATLRTGADGALELRQGASTLAAAANTELEIPQSAAEEGLIERIVQIRGNAFYNIGKRTGTRLRVETPYLVAVIKGTQFNVAAQDDSTTIALFEGHLEVRATDESDVVDLAAGEIAIRHRNDVSISVLRMTAARADRRGNPELAARSQADSAPSRNENTWVASSNRPVAARDNLDASRPRVDGLAPNDAVGIAVVDRAAVTPEVAATVVAKAEVDIGAIGNQAGAGEVANTRIDTTVSAGSTEVAANVGTSIDLGGGAVSAGGAVETTVAGASVDAGATASVDLGAGSVAAGGNVAADLGSVSADVGTGAAVDVGAGTVDVNADATVAAGDVGATVSVDAGTSGGAANIDAELDANVGSVSADTSVGATIDVGGTTSVDASASVTPGLDVQADVGVGNGNGNVGVDVGVAGVDVGLNVGTGGIDLGLGGSDDSTDGGGLLGGLLHRRRTK